MAPNAVTITSRQIWLAALLYFVLASATIALTTNETPFWPANAVLAALMLRAPRERWRDIVIAGFIAHLAANWVTRSYIAGPALLGVASMVELLVFAWGLGAPVDGDEKMRDPSALTRLLFWAGIGAPGVSAVIGAAGAWLTFGYAFLPALTVWMMADSLGLLLFVPLFYSLFSGEVSAFLRNRTPRQAIELAILLALVAITALSVFRTSSIALLFLIPLPIMLVTFRLGWLATKVAVVIVAAVVGAAIVEGTGPFAAGPIAGIPHVIFAQIYLASLLLMQMPVAAALTSRAEMIERFAKSEKSVRMLAEQSQILLLRIDGAGRFIGVFGAASTLIGKSEGELLGNGFDVLVPEIAEPLRRGLLETTDRDGFDQVVEFAAPGKPGRWHEARFRILEHDWRAGFEVGLTIQDVTDRKRRERELAKRAHMDAMTGVLNRAGFLEKAQRQLGQASDGNIFMALVDVDRFKLINDNLGHAAGDVVLQAIADRMKNHLRVTDLIGRLGGDEFAIMLPDMDFDEARKACDRLVAAVAASPVPLPAGASVAVGISCGVAQWNGTDSLDALQHQADVALYEAKRGGRNQTVAA